VPITYKSFNGQDQNDNDVILLEEEEERENERERPNQEVKSKNVDWKALVKHLDTFISTKLEPGSVVSFEQLIKLEQTLLNAKDETFLEFLFKNKRKFEDQSLGITLINSDPSSRANLEAQLNSKRKSFLNHLKQLSSNFQANNIDQLKLEHVLCKYYGIQAIEQLAIGNLKCLSEQVLVNGDTVASDRSIVFENSILDYNLSAVSQHDPSQDEDLGKRLRQCPLLENVYDYLNWSDAHSHKYGELKQFVSKLNSENTNLNLNIDLLEVEPFSNQLYKLTRDTSMDKLKESIESADHTNTAGHLVSLISIKYRTLGQTPFSLLKNEIESSLSALLAKTKLKSAGPLDGIKQEFFDYFYGQKKSRQN
jgi:hypothetical protein